MSSNNLKRRLSLEDLVTSKTKRQRYDELQYLNPTGQRELDPFLLACPRDEFPSDLERNVVLEINGLRKPHQLSNPGLPESKPEDKNSSSFGKQTDIPLFTFDQVMKICGQRLKEREEEIQTNYEDFLKRKSAEQYDAFVKFTLDQIQRNYETPPNYYLS